MPGRHERVKEVRIIRNQWETWVEQYSLPLFRWTLHKLGVRAAAEDLSQEIWLQFFSVAKKQRVENPEHLLFRIARYVWCKQLRQKKQEYPLPDTLPAPDFSDKMADDEEDKARIRWLHEKITRMSRLHRETMILYYIEQLTQRQIAEKLQVPESTVRWYLFDTRRKLREDKEIMEQNNFAYRPKGLSMGINGIPVPELATKRIQQNLLMQNILIACYQEPKTPEEISAHLGVACAYVENELNWLLEQEFVTEEKGRYAASFLIRTSEQENQVSLVFEKHKAPLIDSITRHMLDQESRIRQIGFIGCDRPMNKLMWLLLYHFTRQIRMPAEMPERPFRPDGGQYWPLGFVRGDETKWLRSDWAYNGTMCSDDFFWFGLYIFGQSDIEQLMDGYSAYWHGLKETLKKLIRHEFQENCIAEGEKDQLAALIEKGFILKEEGRLAPNFVIFTCSQYDELRREIFRPLEDKLQPALQALKADMEKTCRSVLPRHLSHLTPLLLAQSITSLDFEAEYLAFRDGHLYCPKDQRDGEFLTLAYVLR